MNKQTFSYGTAILSAFEYLLENYPEVFVIGQGLWSPWYVGNSMTNLEKKFGSDRVIDTPVSEAACTGAAVGASLAGMRPVVVHPRMDFMLYAMDPIVNQAAKWSYMFSGKAHPGLTIRAIINRGGEQGAQHSQALHSWFAHIPGLRVVMPSSVSDARDLLIASVLCPDPVLYIDDRWLYEQEEDLPPIVEQDLRDISPKVVIAGDRLTLFATSYSTYMSIQAAKILAQKNIFVEVIDGRVINPFNSQEIIKSVKKTGRLLVVDGGWSSCGFAGEVISATVEQVHPRNLKIPPQRITLPPAPAPTAKILEDAYYPTVEVVVKKIEEMICDAII